MFKSFGGTKAVFVNQDEGMFIAFPITFDSTVLTLETENRGGRTIVKAGSLVKEGTTPKGITAEEFDITDGPVTGRIVVEGYAWAEGLTPAAIAAVSKLPKIVVMPYNYVSVALKSVNATTHKAVIRVMNGAKFKSTFSSSNITATLTNSATASYAVSADGTELTVTASAASKLTVTAIAIAGLEGPGTDAKVYGLPIEAEL